MFTAHAQKKAIVRSDSADLSLAKDKFEWGPPVSPSPSSAQLPDMSTVLGSLLKERIFTSVLPRPRYSSFTKAAIVVGLDEGKLKLHDVLLLELSGSPSIPDKEKTEKIDIFT